MSSLTFQLMAGPLNVASMLRLEIVGYMITVGCQLYRDAVHWLTACYMRQMNQNFF